MGSQPVLSQNEAFARIRLLRSPNIGPVSYRQLLARFGSAGAALDALPDLASRGRGPYRPARAESIEREVAAVRKAGARYLFHDQSDYPALLAELDSAPPNMTCRGRLALGHAPCVALAGARNASAAAVKLARDFGAALAEASAAQVTGWLGALNAQRFVHASLQPPNKRRANAYDRVCITDIAHASRNNKIERASHQHRTRPDQTR